MKIQNDIQNYEIEQLILVLIGNKSIKKKNQTKQKQFSDKLKIFISFTRY